MAGQPGEAAPAPWEEATAPAEAPPAPVEQDTSGGPPGNHGPPGLNLVKNEQGQEQASQQGQDAPMPDAAASQQGQDAPMPDAAVPQVMRAFLLRMEELTKENTDMKKQLSAASSPWPGSSAGWEDDGSGGGGWGWGSNGGSYYNKGASSNKGRGGRGGGGGRGSRSSRGGWDDDQHDDRGRSSRDDGGRSRDRNGDNRRDARRDDGERDQSPPTYRGALGVVPREGRYRNEVNQSLSTDPRDVFRPVSVAYQSEGDAAAFLDDGPCHHCRVKWTAGAPDGVPFYGNPFPCGIVEEGDYLQFLRHCAKNVKDWSSNSTRAHSFVSSLYCQHFLTDRDCGDLGRALSKPGVLWRPSLLEDRHDRGESGWLCQDTRNITLFCRYCKRSTGWVRCIQARGKDVALCNGHEEGDQDEWPRLAGSNRDHQEFVRGMLTNLCEVTWMDERRR